MSRRLTNRLYDRATGGQIVAIKADLLFRRAIKRMVAELGYANQSEAIYDALYSKLNEIEGKQVYPSLEGFKEKKSKEEAEMERALANLTAFRSKLGVMKARQ